MEYLYVNKLLYRNDIRNHVFFIIGFNFKNNMLLLKIEFHQ